MSTKVRMNAVMTGNIVALDEPMLFVVEKKTKIIHAVMYAFRGRVDGEGPFEVRPYMTGCYAIYRGENSLTDVPRAYARTDATQATCLWCIGGLGEKYWPQGCMPQKEYPEWPL